MTCCQIRRFLARSSWRITSTNHTSTTTHMQKRPITSTCTDSEHCERRARGVTDGDRASTCGKAKRTGRTRSAGPAARTHAQRNSAPPPLGLSRHSVPRHSASGRRVGICREGELQSARWQLYSWGGIGSPISLRRAGRARRSSVCESHVDLRASNGAR
jgi:hypothetical protein